MSDRPSKQGPSERVYNGGNREAHQVPVSSPPPPTHPGSRPTSGFRSVTSPLIQSERSNPGRYELPPLPQVTGTGGSFSSSSRPGAVCSILNPTPSEDQQSNRRRKASHLESPASSVQSLPPIVTSAQGSHVTGTLLTASPASRFAVPQELQPRRILTPRSPSLHRAASLGQLNPSAGTINAQTTPFPSSPRSRVYAVEPGVGGAPPLPTPPAGGRSGYGFSAPTPSSEAARRAGQGTSRTRGPSSSASPSTSYSSYSQIEQTSPATHYAPMSMATLSAPYTAAGESVGAAQTGNAEIELQRPMGIPITASGGQNVIQMMTYPTSSGPVQLPVDVHAASRAADEKRRRNAGASARFRQRRKEKEKEAATAISRLEQQVKELGEDADFYRRERDNLAQIVQNFPGGSHHFPRPSSPRLRRGPAGSHSRRASHQRSPDFEARGLEEGRHVRRRTSTYSLPPPPPPPPQQSMPGGSVHPSYAPMAPHQSSSTPQTPSAPLSSPFMRGPFPGLSHEQDHRYHQLHPPPQLPPGPPQVLQTAPQPGPWNPYAADRRYHGPSNPPREGRQDPY